MPTTIITPAPTAMQGYDPPNPTSAIEIQPTPTVIIKPKINDTIVTPIPGPTLIPTPVQMPTIEPSPTKTSSPGFIGLLALLCLLFAIYMALRKDN
jgi:hypothetical protein